MDRSSTWRILSARRLKVQAKDKRVQRSGTDNSSRVEFIDAKLAELRGAESESKAA